MMKYFDIHGHVNFPEFDADRDDVIRRADEASVGMITVGTNTESSKAAVALANKYSQMWATVAIHPNDISREMLGDNSTDWQEICHLSENKKVVAIGECGLDYFHSKSEDIEMQREIFYKHIDLANNLGKPLMLHIRNGKDYNGAYKEAIQILKERAKVKANFHFFAGNIDDLKAVLDIGSSVSFTGVITFTRDYDELIQYAPLDRIMSETDCPYVAPTPYRGQRNEPAYVIEVVKKIAELKGMSIESIGPKLVENAMNFFLP